MKQGRRTAVAAGLVTGALALAGAATALADFPYSPGSGTDLHKFSTFHTDPGQVPNDFGDDWKFAATPENSTQSVGANNWKQTELCGIRGASVVDAATTFSSAFWASPPAPPGNACQSLGGQPVHTAWTTTTGRPDVTIAVMDSGIMWNDAGAMKDLRNKVRLNTGELPRPEVGSTPVDPSLAATCAGYDTSGPVGSDGVPTSGTYDANGDGIVNLADYACDPRVHVVSGPSSPRHGPNGMMTPEDLIIAFGNCQIDSGTHLITGCTPGVHYDNDHNGFANDIAGWDFVDNKNNPYDDVQYGHGTGEAGDSTAEANNSGGLGTCPNCMVLPLRVGESFVADVNRFAQAVLYATDSGAYVVQEALGSINNSTLSRDAVNYAYDHGVTVIASAADEAAEHHNWPSSLPHVVVVNSVTQYDSTFTPVPNSYLQFNGCTNFSTKITVAVPSSSCSSEATGKSAGVAGLIYSSALNAIDNHTLTPNQDCRRVNGLHCPLTANEVRQLMASGNVNGSAPADQGSGQADDINFAQQPEPACNPVPAPTCTDPNRNTAFDTSEQNGGAVVSPLAETHRYPARKGFDEFYGYGRLNAYKAVSAVAAAKIPPEADITSPDWFQQLDPNNPSQTKIPVGGRVDSRSASYTCQVEVAPGGEPNNAPASASGDFHPVSVPSDWCNGTTARSGAFSGTLAQIDVATLKGYFPPSTVGNFDGREPGLAYAQTSNGRPSTMPYAFTVRVVVTTTGGSPMTGEDRRQMFLHRDADTLNSHFPIELHTDGAATPVLADLDGDNRNELVVATSDGVIHAYRSDGTELPGWPVHTDPLALHTNELAFAGGPISTARYGAVLGALAAGDLFHDGRTEIVATDNEGKVYAWDGAGNLVFKRESNPAYSGNPIYPGSDPLKEYFSVRQQGPCTDHHTCPSHRSRTEHGFVTAPVLAHLDGNPNGPLDILAASEDRHLYAWHADGTPVAGFPVLMVDPNKVSSVDPTTNAVTFNANAGPVNDRQSDQGKVVDTPAVANIDGSGKPSIILGSNEQYGATDGNEGGFNAGNFNTGSLGALSASGQLHLGNTRVYAIKHDGTTSGNPFLWTFKVGIIFRGLLPDVGEGLNGSPAVGPVNCASGPGSGSPTPHIAVIPDAGPGYVLNSDGTGCYGTDSSNGKPIALQTDFSAGAGKYDTPAIPAVGNPSFANLNGECASPSSPTCQLTLLAPAAGAIRALDLGVNEYQGGQDFVSAWNASTGQFRPGYPSPVNDLQFLTGPSAGIVDQTGLNESVLEGTASQDLTALNQAGAPIGTNWPKLTGDWTIATPVLGSFGTLDTESTAKKDVVSITRAGTLTVYGTPAAACSPSSWPRAHHDNANSGDYTRDAVAPGKPMNAAVSGPSPGGSTLTFTAPGNDLMCGTADHYDVRTSSSPITPQNFASAQTVANPPAPMAAGTSQSMILPPGTLRYVAVRAVDGQGNIGLPAVVDTGTPSPPNGSGPLISPSGGAPLGVGTAPGSPNLAPSLGLPSNAHCVNRTHFVIRVRAPAGVRLRSARVYVNSQRVRSLRGRRLHRKVDLQGLPQGTFTVKIVARTKTGKRLTSRRTYRACPPARTRLPLKRHRRR